MKTPTLSYTLRMPVDLKRSLEKAANRAGMSVASLIVKACWHELDRDRGVVPEARDADRELVAQQPRPTIEDLRDVCAGKLGREPKVAEIVSVDSAPQLQKFCIVCDSPMREVKGKWACADVSCTMCGIEATRFRDGRI